ncbi:TPA: hypothetical protein ACIJ25_003130 [Pseudomonas aeruginosa]
MASKPKKQDWGPRGAFATPKVLMAQQDFREMSWAARKVLDVLTYHFNGRNNGNLAATHSMLEEWGGMSKTVLAASLRELQERNLIVKTRSHNRARDGARPALYALAWLPIDECPGADLEIGPTTTPHRKMLL